MVLKVFDIIIAEGSELECAIYTHALLESFRLKNEMDKRKDVNEWLKKYGEKTFEELMRMERDDEE